MTGNVPILKLVGNTSYKLTLQLVVVFLQKYSHDFFFYFAVSCCCCPSLFHENRTKRARPEEIGLPSDMKDNKVSPCGETNPADFLVFANLKHSSLKLTPWKNSQYLTN